MIESVIIIVVLAILLVLKEIQYYFERKTLLDRIMSKNYKEYVHGELAKEEVRAMKDTHSRVEGEQITL